MSNYQLSPFKPWFNVKDYGARGNRAADDTAAIQRAINAASAVHPTGLGRGGVVYFPAGYYRTTAPVVIQNVAGITLLGDGPWASLILADFDGTTVFVNGTTGSGAVSNICGYNLQITVQTNTHQVDGLDIRNCLFGEWHNVIVFGWSPDAAHLGQGIRVRGSGFITFENCQGIGAAGLEVGDNTGGLTATGPLTFIGGHYQGFPSVRMTGDWFSIKFQDCMWQTGTVAPGFPAISAVTVDANNAIPNPTAGVIFDNCHCESDFDSTNSGQTYLIGAVHSPGTVIIKGGSYWGHGTGINYRQYFCRIVSCTDFLAEGVLASKLNFLHGYDGGMFRFTAGYPAAGNKLSIIGCDKSSVTGPLYSDAAALVPAAYLEDIIDRTIRLRGSQIWTPGAIANASLVFQNVAVAGAALGDIAETSFSVSIGNLLQTAQVIGANTANVVLGNLTGGIANIGIGTSLVIVKKFI